MLNPYKCHTWFGNEFVIKKSTHGWFEFQCPMCNELVDRKKMTVHYQYEMVKCWVCGYKKRIIDFVMDYLNVDYLIAKEKLNSVAPSSIDLEAINALGNKSLVISDVSLPVGFQTILEGKGVLGDRARNYLLGRGFDLEELDKKGIGYCNEQALDKDDDFFGYIIIPFKIDGKLAYFIGRDFIGNFLRYKNPPKSKFGIGKNEVFFNEDALRLHKEVQISEGWADACEMGRTGISTQGWSLSTQQKGKLLRSACDVFTFLPDVGEDSMGRTFYSKAVEAAIDYLDHKEVYVLDLSVFSALGKDANAIGRKHILTLRQKSAPLTLQIAADILTQ